MNEANFYLEHNESQSVENIILEGLCLIQQPRETETQTNNPIFYVGGIDSFSTIPQLEEGTISRPEDFIPYFPEAHTIEPDKICRPDGDTTIFTSAGIQHIETILREKGDLDRDLFAVAQPVIRSQFMDKVKDGTSTAFINFSVGAIDTDVNEFNMLCQKLSSMIIHRGVPVEALKYKVETIPDKWGERAFTKTVLTIYAKEIEIGEGVFIHDYPVKDDRKIAIADVCLGVERLNWAINPDKPYLEGFDSFYSDAVDSNAATATIDCIRTSVLMAGEGVRPSHNDPGFRLRRLSKKFVDRNRETEFDTQNLIESSWKYWEKWGFKPEVSMDEVESVLKSENVRNYNNMILLLIEKNGGPKINSNINQPTESLLRQLQNSLPPKVKQILLEVIKDLHI